MLTARYAVDDRVEGLDSSLGLPIVKWIAEANRGSVSLEIAPERGSSFTVSLPAYSTRQYCSHTYQRLELHQSTERIKTLVDGGRGI